MQIRQLQHFEALYRLRSFAAAAQEHEVTQSALSRSIQKLEAELGGRLFDRTTHAVEPTEIGEGLIRHARNVVEAVLVFEEEAARLEGGATGHVRIGVGPYPAQPLLTTAIAALSEKHEGIQVSVVTGSARDLLASLLRRELECVVCDVSKYEDEPVAEDLDVIELPSEPLVIVMNDAHPLLEAEAEIEAFARHPWAMPTPAPVSTRDMPKPFDVEFAAGRFPFYRLETTSACLDLARAGHTLTMVPRSLALEACRSGGLVSMPAPPPLCTNDGIHLVRNRSRSPATRLLIERLVEVAQQLAD
ncbi:MAG: LysR family transcriptional regulator [Myxococcota bacterium]|jgi:DNA-binding transcriptional LysR family regulator|nr:LysR family transcriptional regulator [Myxococcota bacterium]